MSTTSISAQLVVDATAEAVVALLSDPSRHHELDATGMVGAPVTAEPLSALGQVFTMNMTYRGAGSIERYRSDNHVTALDPGSRVAWATATHGGPPLGWTWCYDVEPDGDGTRVTLTYDWTETSQEDRDRFGVPLLDPAGLEASLLLLARAMRRRTRAALDPAMP